MNPFVLIENVSLSDLISNNKGCQGGTRKRRWYRFGSRTWMYFRKDLNDRDTKEERSRIFDTNSERWTTSPTPTPSTFITALGVRPQHHFLSFTFSVYPLVLTLLTSSTSLFVFHSQFGIPVYSIFPLPTDSLPPVLSSFKPPLPVPVP